MSETVNLTIKLGMESSNVKKQVSEVNKELSSLKKQIQDVNDSTDGYNKSQTGLKETLSLQIKSQSALNEKISLQKKIISDCQTTLEKRKATLAKLEKYESGNTEKINKARKAVETAQTSLNKANRDLANSESELAKLDRAIDSTRNKLKLFNDSVNNMSVSQKLQNWCRTTGDSLKTLGSRISNIGTSMVTSSAMFLPATFAITKAFKGAYGAFTEWETSLKNVQAVSGFTTEQMKQVANVTKQLGAEMPLTAKEVSDAFGYMSLAGYDFEQQMDSIEGITKASIAWGSDLARTSDLITDSLSSLQMGTSELNHYIDVVTKTQNKSNTSAIALSEAYIECGGTLANLGIEIEDSATALGVLANRGIKGSEAGRALQAVLINLTSGTSKSKKALKELGIEVYDQNGKFKGLETVLGDLNLALSNCTDEQRDNYLTMIAGKTRISDLNALLTGFSDEWGELSKEIKNADGTLESVYQTMMNTTENLRKSIASKFEAIGIRLMESIEKPLKQVLKYIDEFLGKFTGLSDEFYQIVAIVGTVIAVIAPLGIILGTIVKGIGMFVSLIGSMFKGVASIIGGTIKAIKVVGSAVSFILSPIGLVVAAIAAFVAGLIYAYRHCENFRNVVNKAFDAVKKKIDEVIKWATPYLRKFLEWLPKAWNDVTEYLGDCWEQLSSAMVKYWEWFDKQAKKIWDGLTDFWNRWGNDITTVFSFIWDNIKFVTENAWKTIETVLTIAFEGIKGAVDVFLKVINGDWSGAWETIQTTTKTVWTTVKDFIIEMADRIWNKVKETFTWICENAPTLWNNFCTFIGETAGKVKDTIVEKFNEIAPKVEEFLKELPGKIYDWLCEVIPKVYQWGVEMRDKAVDALFGDNGFVWKIGEELKELPGKIYDWLCEVLPKIAEWGAELGTNAWNAITGEDGIIEKVKSAFTNFPTSFYDWLCETYPKVVEWGTGLGQKAYESITAEDGILAKLKEALGVDSETEGIGAILVEAFSNGVDQLDTWTEENLGSEGEKAGELLVQSLDESLGDLPETFTKWLAETIQSIIGWEPEVEKEGENSGEKFKFGINKGLTSLPSEFDKWLKDCSKKIQDWKIDIGEKGREAVRNFIENGLGIDMKKAPTTFWGWLCLVTAKIPVWGTQLKEAAKKAVGEFFKGLGDELRQLPSKLLGWLTSSNSSITSWGLTGKTLSNQAGQQISSGLQNGLSGLSGKLYDIGVRAVKSLGNGLEAMRGWLSQKWASITSTWNEAWGKDTGITVNHEYETDAQTGLENTVWSYGKDVAKTISLADINYNTSAYADSSYITNNSVSNSRFNGSYKYGGGSQANTSDKSLYDLLGQLLQQKQEPSVNLTIEHFENNREQDVEQLCKEISFYLQLHNKRW